MNPRVQQGFLLLAYLGIFAHFPDFADPVTILAGTIAVLATFGVFARHEANNKRSSRSGNDRAPSLFPTVLVLALYFLGNLGGSVLLAGLSWCLLTLNLTTPPAHRKAWLWVALYALPWIQHDLAILNPYVRLTYASSLEQIFNFLQMPVSREGVYLWLYSIPVSIDPPCAGFNTWQTLLLAGGFLFIPRLRHRNLIFMPLILSLFAWFCGLLRILLSCAICIAFNLTSMSARVHESIGLVILLAAIAILVPFSRSPSPPEPRPAATRPATEV